MPPSVQLTTKIKVQLKLSIARLRMVQKRDEALSKQARRAMAQLLDAGKEDSARIRVENIIRSDVTTELHEILELYCELLLARAGLLDAPTCDPGLEEAVRSIIYAASKTEIKELQAVRLLFAEKFGKEFMISSMENTDGKVSEKVVRKLSVTPPRDELVTGYLEEIAKAYGVNWPRGRISEPPPDYATVDDLDGGGDGDEPSDGLAEDGPGTPGAARKDADAREELSKATPPREFGPNSPLHINPPTPSTDNIHPKVTLNSIELKPKQKSPAGVGTAPSAKTAQTKNGGSGSGSDIDELAKRFAALKR